MGQVGEKCSCLFDKSDKSTYNFEEEGRTVMKYNNSSTKSIKKSIHYNAKFNDSDSVQKIRSVNKLSNHEINEKLSKLNNKNKYLLLRLQAVVKGFVCRRLYEKNRGILRSDELDLIDKYINDYTSPILNKAESYYDSAFDYTGWQKYYPDSNGIYQYDYGLVFKCSLRVYADRIYMGEMNLQGERHGEGVMITKEGEKYQGGWRNDNFTGWGRYIDNKGNLYEGDNALIFRNF